MAIKVEQKLEVLKSELLQVVEAYNQAQQVLENSSNNELEKHTNEIKRLLSKFSLTDVVQIVHKLTGINKNRVYKWVLNFKKSI